MTRSRPCRPPPARAGGTPPGAGALWRGALTAAGIAPGDVHTLADLPALPFSRKADFRDQYPYGLLAVEMDDVVRVHGSSGTSGKPIVVAYTQSDIDLWATLMARTLACGTVTRRDVVHNAYGYGLFTGGLGVHYGAERLGAAVVPSSGGDTRRQIMLIQDLGATVLCCTLRTPSIWPRWPPRWAWTCARPACGWAFSAPSPGRTSIRREIEERLGLQALDIYGLSEVLGPGVAAECPHRTGLHIWEDHFLPEVVDPASGTPLPDGTAGEMVLTTLTKEALPVLRYRTGDITRLHREPCPCGRTMVRMDKVSGRADDMLIVRGVNVFPSQIEAVLMTLQGVQPHYLILVDRQHAAMDSLEVWVEVDEAIFTDRLGALADLQARAAAELRELLGITARVRLVEPHRIERSMGKSRRVIDRREVYSA